MLNISSYRPISFGNQPAASAKNEGNPDVNAAQAKINELQEDLKYQMAHPPKTCDLTDWGYYNIYMDRLQNQIAELRKTCPLDKTNLDEVLKASPSEIFEPKEALNIKGKGISFCQNLPETEEQLKSITYNAVPIFTESRTVEDMIKIGERDGIEIEPFKDKEGNYHIGIKNIWNAGEYFGIDRAAVAMQYGEYPADTEYTDQSWAETHQKNGKIMDCAVVANDSGAQILGHSYVHAGGENITSSDMTQWGGFRAHKDGTAIINAVAFDEPQTVQTLEGEITSDVVMGDVDGNAYNNFKQLKKQILPDKNGYSKLRANPDDPNSAKFIELILAGEDDKAKELLRQATKASM